MAKLFPPLLSGVIPAFYKNENGAIKIVVPFSLNRAVSPAQIKNIRMKIKTTQSSTYLYEQDATSFSSNSAIFLLRNADNLLLGQFYKIQIAFIDNTNQLGYYSSVGVAKYTTKPKVYINNFEDNFINANTQRYTGVYSQVDGDITEREYSYRFDVYDETDTIIATSGDQLHNSSNDTELNETYDEFEFNRQLDVNKIYRMKYIVETINGLKVSSPRYKITQRQSASPDLQANLVVNLSYPDGYIDVELKNFAASATGSFLLSRSTNEQEWDELYRFQLTEEVRDTFLYRDFTFEQGKEYIYSVQQYNSNGLYSNRLLSNKVEGNFEDAFLFDGKRQLKIRFNPKVSTFKTTVLEAKTDTIGGRYPFIFRNGNTAYKEFPISGLISYQMDENSLFFSHLDYETTTNLTDDNLAQEREFKLNVYDWLNNGEPKLFRSPGEGNYIVRLMNVSLTPNDTVGRMLHTFNATAYEIADYDYKALNAYDFIKADEPSNQMLYWETIQLSQSTKPNEKLNAHSAQTVRFLDMMPGDKVIITFENGEEETIQIGATGSYCVDTGIAVSAIKLDSNAQLTGQVLYSYYDKPKNSFDKIESIEVVEVPTRQFIGEHDILEEITCVYNSATNTWVKNPKIELLNIFAVSAEERNVEKVQKVDDMYYKDMDNTMAVEVFDPFTIYDVGLYQQSIAYSPSRKKIVFQHLHYEDLYNNKTELPKYEPYLLINGSQIMVKKYSLKEPGLLKSLVSKNGISTNITYQICIVNYAIENEPGVIEYKNTYQSAVLKLNNYLKDASTKVEDIELCQKEIDKAYTTFILKLIEAQLAERKANGYVE